jgi:hypothetical protein
VTDSRYTFEDEGVSAAQKAVFDCARRILIAGTWLIENGNGRLAIRPYLYATGHWRCEFHLLYRPKKTVFRYSIANGSAFLASHCGGSIHEDVGPESLAQAIWVSVPDDLKEACSGEASRKTLAWAVELRRQLGLERLPAAFGEYFGERSAWQLLNVAGNSDGLKMPAMPGYVEPGGDRSVLEDPFWSKAERRAMRLAKRPEFSLPKEALGDGEHIYEIANRLRRDMADVDSFEAPRLFKAAIAALQCASAAGSALTDRQCEVEVSTQPAHDSVAKRATRLLSMVHELHKAGYQRLRVACGWDAQGKVWRARLMPSSRVSDDGWSPIPGTAGADYSTADGKTYFGWNDAASDDARALANKFIRRFPDISRNASDHDWGYAGWFSMALGEAEHGELPAFFGVIADGPLEFPPQPLDNSPAHSPELRAATGCPLISNDDLTSADLPPPGADYLDVVPFCLSFDGYKDGLLEVADCWAIAEKAQRAGLANCSMDAIRTVAFIHQRKLKNDSDFVRISVDHPSMRVIARAIAEIRNRLA